MKSLTLTITGMSCGHCLHAVNRALSNVTGVELRGVQMGRAELSYAPEKTDPEKIIAAVETAGYTAIASSV